MTPHVVRSDSPAGKAEDEEDYCLTSTDLPGGSLPQTEADSTVKLFLTPSPSLTLLLQAT